MCDVQARWSRRDEERAMIAVARETASRSRKFASFRDADSDGRDSAGSSWSRHQVPPAPGETPTNPAPRQRAEGRPKTLRDTFIPLSSTISTPVPDALWVGALDPNPVPLIRDQAPGGGVPSARRGVPDQAGCAGSAWQVPRQQCKGAGSFREIGE